MATNKKLKSAYEIKTEMNSCGFDATSVRLKGLEYQKVGTCWPTIGVKCVNNDTNWSNDFAEQWNTNNLDDGVKSWYVEPLNENTILFVKKFHDCEVNYQTIELEEVS